MAPDGIVIRAVVALVFVSLAGCSDGDRRDAKDQLLRQRLDGIEKRLGSLESRMGPVGTVAARLGGLESRLAALEAKPAPAAPSPRASAPNEGSARPETSAVWSPPPSEDPAARRDQFSALRDEFQSRLTTIQRDGANGTPEARDQALRDLSQWYAIQLRGVLGGAPWPDPGEAR
jgi:hypothetical protein